MIAVQVGYGDWDKGLGASSAAGADHSGVGTSSADLTAAPAVHETPIIDKPIIDQADAGSLYDTSSNAGQNQPAQSDAVASDLLSRAAYSVDGTSGIATEAPADLPVGVDSHQFAGATGQESQAAPDLLRSAGAEHHWISDSVFSHSATLTPAYWANAQTSVASDILGSGASAADPSHPFHVVAAPVFGGEALPPQEGAPQQAGASATAGSSAPAISAFAAVSLANLENPAAGSHGSADTSASASVASTGATAAQVQQALDESGLSVNGTGIKVGVLSDSFNDLGGAAADEADGALPASVQVLKDLAAGGSDEGRAMMQIVHDIAPGASLAFYTADHSEQDFANGILALAAAGAKVIVDDVSYFDEPFFQNGVVAQAIQTVETEGVTYVAAAGNEASNGYQAAFTPISGTFDGVFLSNAESFGGSLVQTVTVNTEGLVSAIPLVLQWSQPYGAATSDVQMYVFKNGTLIADYSNIDTGQELNNPLIIARLATGTYQIAIVDASGPIPALIKEVTFGDGLPATISGANTGTVVGHAETPGAITAGAVSAADTPAFGFSPTSESFSSSGAGTELLFANNGTALSSPDLLSPVAVSGVDDIHTTVAGGLSDFYGTSASSASLAGVAALILSANPNLTPAQVEHIMEETALPMANSAVSGAGLVQVDAAIAAALPSMSLSATAAQAQQGGAAVALLSAAPSITDLISSTQSSATIIIANGSGSAVSGDELFINGQQSGTVDGGLVTVNWNDSTKVLTLTGSASTATYQTLLSEISYQDAGTDLSTGGHPQHTVTWTINDGTSNFSATSQIAIERSPAVTAANVALNTGYVTVAASSLFTASDPDNDPIVTYAVENTGNGNFVLNGVVQAHNQEIDVTAAQLAQLTYQNATGADTLQVRVSDGTLWSSWTSFTVTGPTVSVIETDGSNSLTQVGLQYYLYNSGSGPSLKFGGGLVLAGEFGNAAPIAMEATAGGYLVCWKSNDTGNYMVWNVDSSGNYVSSAFPSGGVSGSNAALESYETVFHHDLNGDGVIGPVAAVIETDGSNSLAQVGNNYYLYSSGVGPALNFGGAPVVVGEFGNAAPIAMEPTASGYLVCWKSADTGNYMVWNVDSSGNYVSSAFPSGGVSGSSAALESYETVFHHDLNGDGVIGIPTTAIETDGSNSLTQVANHYYLDSGGTGPSLNFGGAPVVVGEFGNAAPIAMEPTAGGYLVCWKSNDTGNYMVWNVDSSGNYVSSAFPSGAVSGTSAALESYETVFHHDLNGDGVTGLAVGVAATLELPGATAGTVTFAGSTGTLKLDLPSTFNGSIAGFTGDGTLSGSDHIDLATLAFNSLIQTDSTYDTSTHLLSVSNGTNIDVLQFIGNYTAANFKFAADGNGGTIVYDPPATIDIADNRTITGSAELSGSQVTVESGATLTLNKVAATGATITNDGTVTITNNSAVAITAGAGQDNFVFAANFGQATIAGFKPATDTIQIDHAMFASMDALFAAIHDDARGNAVITDAAHDTITIQHVATAQLIAHQGDFHLV